MPAMPNGTWRDHCAPIIASVIAAHQGNPVEMKKALRAAYPYSERKYWPYKVWCSEVRRQMRKHGKPQPAPEGQGELF